MQPITVSLFVPNLAGGGAERVMVNLANGLAARGHRTRLLLLEKTGSYVGDINHSVSVTSLNAPTVRGGVPNLARYLRAERPDILVSALDHANVGALLARRLARVTTRVVPTVHITHSRHARLQRSMHGAALRLAIRCTYRRADAIVAVSRGAAEDMVQSSGVPSTLVRTIYNPVITPRLLCSARQSVDHPWFDQGEVPVVLAMGRLTAQKDFPTLLRAMARVRTRMPLRLLLLGEGEERERLQQLVRQLGLIGEVSLPGFVSNPFALLAHASLFVLSSAWEALPTVLIEALALGVPVVSTNCPSGPTEILQGGRYGRLVPVGDVESMADAIYSELMSPRSSLPAEALQSFTLDAALDAYEQLFTELLALRPSAKTVS